MQYGAVFKLGWRAGNLLDRNAWAPGFLGDGVVLLFNGDPGRFIAIEPTQNGMWNPPVRAAGAILVENIEEGIPAHDRFRFLACHVGIPLLGFPT
jgi:hypothetical protein